MNKIMIQTSGGWNILTKEEIERIRNKYNIPSDAIILHYEYDAVTLNECANHTLIFGIEENGNE